MMYNRKPKYDVHDIVVVGCISYGSDLHDHVVGVIDQVFNHRDTGVVYYHIIFNSGAPMRVFEEEIESKFYTDNFMNGYLIHRYLLVKMYHSKVYKFLSEREFREWAYENFEKSIDYTVYNPLNARPAYYDYRYDPKFMDVSSIYPVKSSLKEITERIAASPIKLENEVNKAVGEWRSNYHLETALSYKKIIFNGPCTIILWKDGSKTIAKTFDEETFDPEKGVAICFMKKMLGHTETNKILRKATKQYLEETDKTNPPTIQETLKTIAENLSKPLISFNKEDN